MPRKHHGLQEFKRLAKQAKVNETRIIVRKLKSLRSSSDKPGTAKHDPADLEAQLDALKVNFVYVFGRKTRFSPTVDSESGSLRRCYPSPETQAQSHSLRQQDRIRIPLHRTPAFSSLHLSFGSA